MTTTESKPLTQQTIDIATGLHAVLCQSDHNAECFWYYHTGLWVKSDREKWVIKAEALLEAVDYDTALSVLAALNKL